MPIVEQARALASGGDAGKAIELLERAVAGGDESAAVCKEIARLCLSINEVRAFTNWCHEAMRLDPGDGEPQLMMARVLMARERWGEAVEALESALQAPMLEDRPRAEAGRLLESIRSKPGASAC